MKLWIDGATMARLKTKYTNDVVPAMMKEFNYKNSMQVPRLEKITLNVGVGEATQNAKAIDSHGCRDHGNRRPKTGSDASQESHRQFQAPRRRADRLHGDAAPRAYV